MTHVRQQLREEVASVVTGLPLTGGRVYQSRVYPVGVADLPCLLITTDSDSVEYLTVKRPATLSRDIQLRIRVIAKATVDLDDKIDQICNQVEVAMANYSSGLNWRFVGTEIELSAAGEQPIGEATMTYRMRVISSENV